MVKVVLDINKKKHCDKWKLNPYDNPINDQPITEKDPDFKQLLRTCKSDRLTKEDCIFFEMTSINPLTNRKINSTKKISDIKELCKDIKKYKKEEPKKINICKKWIQSNLEVNPRTGRSIKPSGKVYKDLEKECEKDLEIYKPQKVSVEDEYEDRDIQVKSTLFKNKTFLVFSGDRKFPKNKLETIIKEHSGKVVQNPSSKTDYLLASRTKSVKISNWVEISESGNNPYGDKDIIFYTWLINSIIEKKILPLHPVYMIYTSTNTQKIFQDDLDDFEDSYTDKATVETLKKSFQMVKDKKFKKLSENEVLQVINHYGKLPHMFLRNFNIDFKEKNELKMLEARLYGAKITEDNPDFVFDNNLEYLDALIYGCKFRPKWCEKYKNKEEDITNELLEKSEKKKDLINQKYLIYY